MRWRVFTSRILGLGVSSLIKRNQRYLNGLNILLDALLIFCSYMVATYIRFDIMYGASPALYLVWNSGYILAALGYTAFIIFLYWFCRMYTSQRVRKLPRLLLRLVLLNGFGIVTLTAFLYFTRITDFSRIALMLFFLISSCLLIIKYLLVRTFMISLRMTGKNLKYVALVGGGALARQYDQSIQGNPQYGFHIAGYFSDEPNAEITSPYLGAYTELDAWLERQPVDLAVIALEASESQQMDAVIQTCEKQGVFSSIIPFFNSHLPAQLTTDRVGACSLLSVQATLLDNSLMAAGKRLFDVVASLLLMIIASPIMLITAVGIKLSSPGPIIFKQVRVGKGKQDFTMYKFRSMRVNAKENTGWTKDDDPRKTKFGSFIRKCSIDELPQLFNVLKGDMSLVGPRPEVPHFVYQFKNEIPRYMLKHQVRPGITGWAQVNNYRGDTSIAKRIECDLWYIEHWSFRLDIYILLKTVFGGMVNSEKVMKNDSGKSKAA